MSKIELKIPEQNCRECPYLKLEVIDHNYYGEKSYRATCSVFDCPIDEYRPCGDCLTQREENRDDILKYANFLVKAANCKHSTIRNKTLDELWLRVDQYYADNPNSVVSLIDLKNIIDDMRK